jgi:polygalacturonase
MKKLGLSGLYWFVLFPLYAQVYDITQFGAQGDDQTDCTQAIQTAIDSASRYGGSVVFPTGTFLSGTVYLKSNITVTLTQNAVWKGIPDPEAYPDQTPSHPSRLDIYSRKAMLYADGVENIVLQGTGTFYPQGEHPVYQDGIADSPTRPYGLWMIGCQDIIVQDWHMKQSAYWMQRYLHCQRLRISGLRVYNHANLNNDGIDIDGCQDVIVSDCHVDSSDDALCFKSEGGWDTRDVVVTNCLLSSHATAFKLGTGSIGGFQRMTISNLVIKPSRAPEVRHQLKMKGGLAGIDIMTVDGGIVEDILIENVTMDSIETPLFVRLGGRLGTPTQNTPPKEPGKIRDVRIQQVIARNALQVSSHITGIPNHPIESITLSDVLIEVQGGGTLQDTSLAVPENVTYYPYNRIFGVNLPSYGLYARHVQKLTLRNVEFRVLHEEARPALVADDIDQLVLKDVDIGYKAATPWIKLRKVRELRLDDSVPESQIKRYR